jgi:uncharacterized protein
MRSYLFGFCLVIIFIFSISTGHADPISFGSSQAGGTTYGIAVALGKEAKNRSGLDIRAIPQRTASQVVPQVNSNAQQLGTTSGIELSAARDGAGAFAGNPMSELRAIGSLFPFRLTFAVRADHPARTVADLKGMRVSSGYRASTTGELLFSAILQASGISFEDVTKVDVSDFQEARELFIEDRADAVHFVVGSGANTRVAQQVGGIRALGIPPSEEVDKILKALHPSLRSTIVTPEMNSVGIENDILVMAYDYVLYTNASMPDDQVAEIANILLDGAETMAESVPAFASLNPNRIAADVGIPYHPAALEVYRARGLPVSDQ